MSEKTFKHKKCKECGEKFTPIYSTLQFICSPKCAAKYAKEQRKKKEAKKWREEKKVMKVKVYSKEYKKYMENEINKLARMIYAKFKYKCIDCGKDYGKQVDAAHYKNKGSNETLRYNLHNLHSAKSDCNQYSSEHKTGYKKGLIERYGEEYEEYIDVKMAVQYSYLGLSETEIYEALSKVRKCIRNFEKHIIKFKDGKEAREFFNQEIGVYASKKEALP